MLALVAGEGALPGVLIRALGEQGTEFRLCELEGHPCAARDGRPVMRFRIETLGTFINDLVAFGTTEICFAGRIDRPLIDPALVDAATMPLVPDIMTALSAGDDAGLRTVLRLFEARGITVVGAQAVAPELLPDPGVLTRHQPGEGIDADLERGIEVIAAMGQADLGQACVIANGQVLAVEAMAGTDWMLRSLMPQEDPKAEDVDIIAYALKRMAEARAGKAVPSSVEMPKGGVLIKAAKPGQDRRVDMPTVGVETVRNASRANLAGMVVEAGNVLMVDLEEMVTTANHLGLFIWVRA